LAYVGPRLEVSITVANVALWGHPMMARGPVATIVVVAFLYLTPWPVDAKSLRIATDQEFTQPGPPVPAVAASPASAMPPSPPPPPEEGGPPPATGPCPLQPSPALPVDQLVKKIKTFGDDGVAGAKAQIKGESAAATAAAIAKVHGAADEMNPLKQSKDEGAFEAEATGPLQKMREELHGNFKVMHDKAEEEAAEVLNKVRESIHNATHATVEVAVAKTEEEHQEFVKETIRHADEDIKYSTKLADTAIQAVHNTMKAIQQVQNVSSTLPQGEIAKANAAGKRAQETSAMFTKQALGVKQIVEQFMELDYDSHHDVVIADEAQGHAYDLSHKAEEQANTNSADIRVLTASIKEANEQATKALQRTSTLGSQILN